MKRKLLSTTLPLLICAAAKMPGGKKRLQEERDKLATLIRAAEGARKPVPEYIRNALRQLNAAIGDAEMQA